MSKIEQDTSTGTPEEKIGGPEDDTISREGLDLMVRLMEQNSRDLAHTTNSLIEGYRESYYQAQAELDAVRWKIESLLNGEYAPSHLALLRALYPSEDMVDSFRKQEGA